MCTAVGARRSGLTMTVRPLDDGDLLAVVLNVVAVLLDFR
jgi:hypothetical protein